MPLNKVMIIGNVGKKPEIRSMNSGDRVANFSMACTEKWKDKQSGERKEKTEWVNVVAWGNGLVGVIEQYVDKGSKVYVEGKMQTRKWQDQSGNDRWSTEVVIQGMGGKLELLGETKGGGSNSGNAQADNTSADYDAILDGDDPPF